MPSFQISLKNSLRWSIKETLKNLPLENRKSQSKQITSKIISSDYFKSAKRISIYLSTEYEVDTIDILKEMFRQGKQVFVPTYKGNIMEMVKLNSLEDYHSLPTTKWRIKQPSIEENRENALTTGGLDLFLIPGVAFSYEGGRLGHGKGYYDQYLSRHFKIYPQRYAAITDEFSIIDKVRNNKTALIGLGFKEQIVDCTELPLDNHDFRLDLIVSSD